MSGVAPLSAQQVLEEVDRLLDAGLPGDVAPWAVFDADGTLWSGDIGLEAFLTQPAAGLLDDALAAPLLAWCAAHHLDATPDTALALHAGVAEAIESGALLERGRAAGRDDDAILGDLYALHAWLYAGQRIADVEAHGLATYEASIRSGVFRSSRPLLEGLTSRGIHVVIVSASPELILRGAALDLGIAPGRAFGMATLNDDERVGREVPRITHGEGKLALLTSHMHDGPRPLLAFGDSAAGGDQFILDAALLPVAVAPSGRHRKRAEARGMRLLDPSR